jgi:hypothetical protein
MGGEKERVRFSQQNKRKGSLTGHISPEEILEWNENKKSTYDYLYMRCLWLGHFGMKKDFVSLWKYFEWEYG